MLTFGFYNSKGGDRKYDAEQIGAMFNGLITDGVFAHYKNALKVVPGNGNRELVVKPGRAWFNGTWTEVDDGGHSVYLMGSAVESTYFVYLAVDKRDRRNSIAWYSNIKNDDPDLGLYFYLLAQVTIPGGATTITDSMITDTRGSDLCPYVTGIMETVSFEEIVKKVCSDGWRDWLGVYEAGITTGVQTAVATSERALDEVNSLKAYAVESEAVSYVWAKFEAAPIGGGGFEWATESVHTELTDPPMPMCLFRNLSYADLGPGFKPNIALNDPYIAEGETAVKAIPAVTQSKVWREYPYFWEGGAAFGTEVLRYDDLERVVVNVGGIASEKYRYRTSRLMHIPVTYEPGVYIGTVTADNATAYPRDGYKGGYYYIRFASRAEDVSFYYPGLSAKNVRDAIIEVANNGGNGSGSGMPVMEVEELPPTGIRGVLYIVKTPGEDDANEYLWLDRWEKIGGADSGHNASVVTRYEYAIENVICIGDSLTAGACYANGYTGQAITQNYPYYIGRMLNCKTNNAGVSGETISGWYANNIVGGKYNFADYDSAIIWLGTNSPCTAMPTDAEISAFIPSSTPDASTANHALYLCEIIKTIKTANPDCFIILCGIFSPSTKAERHNAVALQIANKYGLYFVDMTDLHPTIKPELHANLSDPHFGKAGNIFIASRLSNYIREKIADNPLRAEFGYGDGSGGNIDPDNPAPSGNRVPYAIYTDGSVYNGTGYRDGYRLVGNPPAETEKPGMVITGYIPVTASDIIRMAGTTWGESPSVSYIYFFDKYFNSLGSYSSNGFASYEPEYNGMTNATVFQDKSKQSVTVEHGVTTFSLAFHTADKSSEYSAIASSHIAYMRISAAGNGADMIITLNEEIT